MQIIRDEIWLCEDCLMVAVNGDASGLDYHYGEGAAARLEAIEAGLTRFGPHLVPNYNEAEIGAYCTRRPCECCNDPSHGSRFRFTILGTP